MVYLIPLLSAYIAYLYTYRKFILKKNRIEKKIHDFNAKIQTMTDTEELIISSMNDIKNDFKDFETETRADLKFLRDNVIKLKTKATMIGGISGSVAAVVVSIITALINVIF